MPRDTHHFLFSVQTNTKPPTDTTLTAVVMGINTIKEQIHHNEDQMTSEVTVQMGRGGRTA